MSKQQTTLFELRCPSCSFSVLVNIELCDMSPINTLLSITPYGFISALSLRQALNHTCKPDRFSFVGNRAKEKQMAAESKAAATKLDITKRLTEHRESKELLQEKGAYDKIVSDFENEFDS